MNVINFFIGLVFFIMGLYFIIFRKPLEKMNSKYDSFIYSKFSKKNTSKKYENKKSKFYFYENLILAIIFFVIGFIVILTSL